LGENLSNLTTDTEIKFKLKELSKHGMIYGIGAVLNSLLGFVLIPLYTSKFTPDIYGVFSLITLVGILMGSVFYLGSSSSLVRYYYDNNTKEERINTINSALFLVLIGAISQIIIGILLSKFISILIFSTEIYSNHIIISLCSSSFSFINITYLLLLRYDNKSTTYVLLNASTFVLSFILVLLFFYLDMGLYAPFLGLALGQLSLTVFLIIYYSKYSFISFSKEVLKIHLRYGLPIAISSLIFYLLEWSDRFFIKEMCSLNEVGIYSYGYKLAMMIHTLIVIPFSLIWSQIRMKYKNDKNADRLITLVTTYFSVICLLIIYCLSIFSREIVLLTSGKESYYLAQNIIPIIAIAQYLYGLSNILDYGIAISKKTKFILYTGLTALIINIALNYFTISIWGIFAAAYSKLITYLIFIFLIYTISSKTIKIKVEFKRLFVLCFVMIILLVMRNFLEISLLKEIILSKLLTIILLLSFLVFGFTNKKEKMLIFSFIKYKKYFGTSKK